MSEKWYYIEIMKKNVVDCTWERGRIKEREMAHVLRGLRKHLKRNPHEPQFDLDIYIQIIIS